MEHLQEVLRQDYLTTARAKGLSERDVVGRHALKNALIPVVTIIAITMPRVIGGSTEDGWRKIRYNLLT